MSPQGLANPPGECAILEMQSLLGVWALSSGCSQISLDWKFMLLSLMHNLYPYHRHFVHGAHWAKPREVRRRMLLDCHRRGLPLPLKSPSCKHSRETNISHSMPIQRSYPHTVSCPWLQFLIMFRPSPGTIQLPPLAITYESLWSHLCPPLLPAIVSGTRWADNLGELTLGHFQRIPPHSWESLSKKWFPDSLGS